MSGAFFTKERCSWWISRTIAYGIGFALVCVVNLKPLIEQGQTGAAFINVVLLFFTPFIIGHSGRKRGWTKFGLRVFAAASLFACYYNSVGGVSEGRDTHIEQKVDVAGQIGSWETKIATLKTEDGRIPEHKPITEQQYLDLKEKRDTANRTRDRECSPEFIQAHLKDKTNSQEACNQDRIKADAAQTAFDEASERWGYEQAHAKYLADIAAAQAEIKKLGPKPMAADSSSDRISRIITFGVISAGWISDFIPLLFALLADLAYAFGSPIVAAEMEHTMLGDSKKNLPQNAEVKVENRPLPEVELATVRTVPEGFETIPRTVHQTVQPEPQTLQPDEMQTLAPKLMLPPPEIVLKPPRRESVGEWLANRMNRSKGRIVLATPAYEWYCAYAREIGEDPVTQTLFGRIMKDELKVGKRGGSSPAYLDIAPKPALVKASLVE